MKKILIVLADYYPEISKLLLYGCQSKLKELGYEFEVLKVAGALEIPVAISYVNASNQSSKYQGYIALGCVIRGETSHYDIVCNESARGITKLSIKHQLAIANGILTVENFQQAIARAHYSQKNKGGFCAQACHNLISIKNQLNLN
ncbi:MAG: 6,7-dimethyl-8-ribityllumazine synthase [Alphaproteobacteria bacterium]